MPTLGNLTFQKAEILSGCVMRLGKPNVTDKVQTVLGIEELHRYINGTIFLNNKVGA